MCDREGLWLLIIAQSAAEHLHHVVQCQPNKHLELLQVAHMPFVILPKCQQGQHCRGVQVQSQKLREREREKGTM